VRLLRILAQTVGHSMSAGSLAHRAKLARSSVYHALQQLENSGLVTYSGIGGSQHVQLRQSHPLAPILCALFTAESASFTELGDALKSAASAFPHATSIWIEGPIAAGIDRLGEPLDCFFIGTADELPSLTSHLRSAFAPVEHRYDLTINVHGITRAEVALRPDADVPTLIRAIVLSGTPPSAFHGMAREALRKQGTVLEHGDHDERARQRAASFAERIAADPHIIVEALSAVERRLQTASLGERNELDEWAHLLRTATPRRLRNLLVHPGERMTRLRQTMPFVGLFNEAQHTRESTMKRDASRPT
jgi:IclR helix-turn-helix domain